MKNNYFTKPDRRPPKSKDKCREIDDILSIIPEPIWSSTANICGSKIRLVTNSEHVLEYWKLNWFLTEEEPDGVIFDIKGLENYEPHLYYDLDSKMIAITNCEYYGTAKSAGALGLAGVILKDKYPIHGACVGYGAFNEGILILAPTGTGKTTQSHELLYNVPKTKVHSDDYVFVEFKDNEAIACATEKELYMRTDIAKEHPVFIDKFDNLPKENVKNECYWEYGNSRVVFPRWMFPYLTKDSKGELIEQCKGDSNVIDTATIRYIVLLTRDKSTKPITMLDKEEMIRILKEGRYTIRPGAGPEEMWGKIGHEPWYNPYPPEIDHKRQEQFFRKLYDIGVKFYLLNTGRYKGVDIRPHQTHVYIRHTLEI